MPAPSVLAGLELTPLPEGVVPYEAIVLVKVMTSDGLAWAHRYTSGLDCGEIIGALTIVRAVELEAISSASYFYDEDAFDGEEEED